MYIQGDLFKINSPYFKVVFRFVFSGLLTVLPTVLFLIIGVLRETSKLDKSHFGAPTLPGVVSPPAATALQGLRTLVSRPMMDAGGSAPDSEWIRIVQCALWSTVSLADKDMNSTDVLMKTIQGGAKEYFC